MNTQSEKAPSCSAQKRRSLIVLLVLVAITLGYLALDRSAAAHGSYRAGSMVTAIVIRCSLKITRLD